MELPLGRDRQGLRGAGENERMKRRQGLIAAEGKGLAWSHGEVRAHCSSS